MTVDLETVVGVSWPSTVIRRSFSDFLKLRTLHIHILFRISSVDAFVGLQAPRADGRLASPENHCGQYKSRQLHTRERRINIRMSFDLIKLGVGESSRNNDLPVIRLITQVWISGFCVIHALMSRLSRSTHYHPCSACKPTNQPLGIIRHWTKRADSELIWTIRMVIPEASLAART